MNRLPWVLAVVCCLAACAADDADDGGPIDARPDAAAADAAPADAAPSDAPRDDAAPDAAVVANVNGTFLVAVRAAFERSDDPGLFVQFVVTWGLENPPYRLDGSYVPLCTSSACQVAREMLPPALVATDTAITDAATFAQPIAGTLPGGANPFTGTPQPLDAVFHGQVLSADVVCGDVTGMVAGLDLVGSTFAAVRITDPAPGSLPAPVAACPSL